MRLALLTAAVLVSAPALAQDRPVEMREALVGLTRVLGESHALRQACEGVDDQYWRSRMVRLTEVEQADQAFDAQMRERFNTGFASRRSEYPLCDEASRKAEQAVARKGQALAQKLSQAMREVHRAAASPDFMADETRAR